MCVFHSDVGVIVAALFLFLSFLIDTSVHPQVSLCQAELVVYKNIDCVAAFVIASFYASMLLSHLQCRTLSKSLKASSCLVQRSIISSLLFSALPFFSFSFLVPSAFWLLLVFSEPHTFINQCPYGATCMAMIYIYTFW